MTFGKEIRSEWLLDEDVIFLNHGSFGACPRSVLAVQREWQSRMEAEPVRFMTRELPQQLEAARAELAGFVGSHAEDLVFVHNATDGANAVLRSLLPQFKPGDELLTTSQAYRAIRQTMLYVAELCGATVVDAVVPFPIASAQEVTDAIARAITPRTAFAVVDHITSPTGLVFPITEIIALFKERGIPVLVDGAHAPGQIDLDLNTLGADYYVGNCHKWLYAPKGAAMLWVDKKHPRKIHPTVISHFLGGGFQNGIQLDGNSGPDGLARHSGRNSVPPNARRSRKPGIYAKDAPQCTPRDLSRARSAACRSGRDACQPLYISNARRSGCDRGTRSAIT